MREAPRSGSVTTPTADLLRSIPARVDERLAAAIREPLVDAEAVPAGGGRGPRDIGRLVRHFDVTSRFVGDRGIAHAPGGGGGAPGACGCGPLPGSPGRTLVRSRWRCGRDCLGVVHPLMVGDEEGGRRSGAPRSRCRRDRSPAVLAIAAVGSGVGSALVLTHRPRRHGFPGRAGTGAAGRSGGGSRCPDAAVTLAPKLRRGIGADAGPAGRATGYRIVRRGGQLAGGSRGSGEAGRASPCGKAGPFRSRLCA